MKECKFCTRADDEEFLFEHEWPFGQNVNLRLWGMIARKGLEIGCDMGAEELFETVERINYCPMCGRKLTERKTE